MNNYIPEDIADHAPNSILDDLYDAILDAIIDETVDTDDEPETDLVTDAIAIDQGFILEEQIPG